jgi:aminomethyltransferase
VPEDLLHSTPLTDAHRRLGARMTAFAGYDMPVQYAEGVLKEHLWTREHAGLFDVSHMGPAFLTLEARSGDPDADHAAVSALIEPLVCGDIAGLVPGQLRYTVLLNDEGGIVDDLMIGRPLWEDRQGMLYVVANAARKEIDFARIVAAADGRARLDRADDRALIAVQGPAAADILSPIIPDVERLGFMRHRRFDVDGERFLVSRSGYTGEDGFEVLAFPGAARRLWEALLENARARPVGLGARDSLRLEAGLPLYGHDLDETVSPVEAALDFAISRKRLKAGRMAGAARLARERAEGPSRVRIALAVLQGAPAREGAPIADETGRAIGVVTSGGFSPTLGAPIAMGFVPPAFAAPGTPLTVLVRGRAQPALVTALPFVPHRYHRAIAA